MVENMDFPKFSENLRNIILSQGLTASDFAVKVNIPIATISRYMSGVRLPKISYVVMIAEYCHVTVDWLLGLSDAKFTTMSPENQEIMNLYSMATPEDKKVVKTVLEKYQGAEE